MNVERATRPLAAPDVERACDLIRAAVGGSPYEAMLVEQLRASVARPSVEALALGHATAGRLDGFVLYGTIAGARAVAELHMLVVDAAARGTGVGSALLAHALADLRARGTRFIIAEVPDDARVLGDYWAFLAHAYFREESRIPDLYRDGVDLAILRRDLAPE